MDAQGRRRSVKRKHKRTMLSALGVWPDGYWETGHWQIASGENETTWKAFFGQLYAKGLTEETTKLVGSDDARGLEAALDYHCYGVPHQRCIFDKIKTIADHLVCGALEIEGGLSAEESQAPGENSPQKGDLGRCECHL